MQRRRLLDERSAVGGNVWARVSLPHLLPDRTKVSETTLHFCGDRDERVRGGAVARPALSLEIALLIKGGAAGDRDAGGVVEIVPPCRQG